ncbi:MAG: hypothetical protein Kow00128_14750 [Deltaproteobacteria bacterium]
MNSYVELVSRRLEDRNNNIVAKLDELEEDQLRFTMRVFGDCLDEEARKTLLKGYTEHMTEEEIRAFARNFVPAYGEYALEELRQKKKDGERFEPPYLTQEEYQEMAVREKWPRIARHLDEVTPLQLRRELARTAMLFRPYMLSDPAFNEGVLEFALYFDLLDRLEKVPPDALREAVREIAPLIDQAVGAKTPAECEPVLAEIRKVAANAAGLPADPERLLGPKMELYPREAPPGYNLRKLRMTLKTMSLKDLRLSALVHMDLLTTEETRKLVSPYMSRYPSFYKIPGNGLREMIVAIAEEVKERLITDFFDRYSNGRLLMREPVTFTVWRLMPEEEKLEHLRQDNDRMDSAMMARHLARYLHAASPDELADAGRQIALLTDDTFHANHGSILKNLGPKEEGEGVKRLYDQVTILSLRMMSGEAKDRQKIFDTIRARIAETAGISPISNTPREGE